VSAMPDNWTYVFAAYALAAAALLGYWRYLSVRARTLAERKRTARGAP
jgi:hypothetical protein